jgi:hypothetical protein
MFLSFKVRSESLGVRNPFESDLLLDFPRKPTGVSKAVITQEADYRLSYYLYPDADPSRPKLPSGVVDTPLVRIYNFLRKFQSLTHSFILLLSAPELTSLSYQLEILWFQVLSYMTFRRCANVAARLAECYISDGQTI